jgi:hypothetical protein
VTAAAAGLGLRGPPVPGAVPGPRGRRSLGQLELVSLPPAGMGNKELLSVDDLLAMHVV